MRLSQAASGLAILVCVGCGGGGSKDAGNTDAGGSPDSGGSGGDAGTGRSFDTAIPITVDSAGTQAVLVDQNTKDYYATTLTQGDRIVFATLTAAGSTRNGTVTDTVVTVWNSSRTQVAQDDDAWPRFSTDSTLYFEVPASGTYYVTVEDCHSAFGAGSCSTIAINDFRYKLTVFHVSAGSFPELTAAASQTGMTAQAQQVQYQQVPNGQTGQYLSDVIDGAFRNATDTHVFSFTPPANTSVSAGQRARSELFLQPISATNGDGSTSNAKVCVTDSTGTKVIAQANQTNYRDGDNFTNGPLDLSLPVTLGQQYFLFVQNTAATSHPTTDDYFGQHFVGSWYYGQAEKEGLGGGANDTPATAEVLVTPTTASAGSYFVDGDISPVTDVDWFEADPPAGTKSVGLSCRAARAGSGLVGFTAALYDSTGATLIGSIGPETATADLFTQTNVAVPAGTVKALLKVSAAAYDPTNTGTYYWCSIFYSNM
jgi:hypothetical protein